MMHNFCMSVTFRKTRDKNVPSVSFDTRDVIRVRVWIDGSLKSSRSLLHRDLAVQKYSNALTSNPCGYKVSPTVRGCMIVPCSCRTSWWQEFSLNLRYRIASLSLDHLSNLVIPFADSDETKHLTPPWNVSNFSVGKILIRNLGCHRWIPLTEWIELQPRQTQLLVSVAVSSRQLAMLTNFEMRNNLSLLMLPVGLTKIEGKDALPLHKISWLCTKEGVYFLSP